VDDKSLQSRADHTELPMLTVGEGMRLRIPIGYMRSCVFLVSAAEELSSENVEGKEYDNKVLYWLDVETGPDAPT